MDVLWMWVFCVFCVMQGSMSASCGFPGSPAHCQVKISDETLAEGTVASYECERGFELLGPSRRMCGEDGQWTPQGIPFCVINVAAGKAPMQVSTEEGGVPQRAVDGSTTGVFSFDTCTLTKPERLPWWYVNLLEPYMVQLVRLDFGKPCCDNSALASLTVRVGNNRPDLGTNPICSQFIGYIEEGQPLFLPCNPPMPGAFVSVHLESSIASQLSICEAFVYTDQALPIERCPQFRDQPPGSTATYNGKCYIFYNRQIATFQEALGFCRSRGGTLVDESNPALQGFISWELWRRHRSDSSSRYWLGAARDAEDPSNWKWVNGNDVTVSFWDDPSGVKGCVHFDGSRGWLWAEVDCDTHMNFICQHQPKACGRPEQPPNSTIHSEGFEVGDSVVYSCDEGHLLVGPTVRTCRNTGFYNEFPPICKRIDCGLPAEIPNGRYTLINGTVHYLSHAQYSCDAGYEMAGRARLICDIDARWNGPPPKCEGIQCESPALISNGRVVLENNTTAFGSVAEYSCASGFRLVGDRRISCLATGVWEHSAPICSPEPTTSTTTTTTLSPPPPPPTAATSSTTTPRPILATRRVSTRPSPFVPQMSPETHRPRSKSTTERVHTKPYKRPPLAKVTVADNKESPTSHVPHIVVLNHPREGQIIGNGNNIVSQQNADLHGPPAQDDDRSDSVRSGIGISTTLLLAVAGTFVFIIGVITTAVILMRSRKRNVSKSYHHQITAAEFNTAASTGSSSESPGLNRCYRQAWEQLHEATGGRHGVPRRHEREAPKDGAELVVCDAFPGNARDKRRHHHHHHHREQRQPEWHPLRQVHNHKPRY